MAEFDISKKGIEVNPSFNLSRPSAKGPSIRYAWRAHAAWFWASGFIILLFSSPGFSLAFGQKDTPKASTAHEASIRGTVTTTEKAYAVAGAIVRLSGNPVPSAPLSTQTDENGQYEFGNLAPGTYSVSVEFAGFKPETRSVLLNRGEQKIQDFILDLEAVSEKIEVRESAAAITTESASAPAVVVSNIELVTIPTAQEKVKEVIPTTPGVIQTLDGKLTFKGSDENQSLLIVNSARNTDPATGSFGIVVPTDAVESFAVYKTPYDASLGSFSGGLTTIQTKTPTANWGCDLKRFAISLGGKNGHLKGVTQFAPAITCNAPVIPHKLLVSETFQYDLKKTTIEGLPWPNDIMKRQGFNSFTTVEAILSPNHLLTVTVNAFPMRTEHMDMSALVPQPASNNLNQRGMAIAVSDAYQFESGAVLSAVAQYTRFDSNAQGQGTADMLITPEGWGGNYFNRWSRRGNEFQLLPMYQLSKKQWLGAHEIRVGAEIDRRSFFGTSESAPIEVLRQDNSLEQTINFDPGRSQTPSDSFFAEFVQDHWLINSHLSADLGTRLSTETSGWSAAFAPRVGLAYSPGTESKTIIRAGAGMFYGVLPLLAASWGDNPTRTITEFNTSGIPIGPSVRYNNVYAAGLDPLVSPVLPSGPSTTPRNLTWNAGVARELHKNLQLDLSYINSHTSYLFVVDPLTGIPTGQSFMALTNTGSSMYHEASASVHYTFHESDQVNGSYIWSRTRGDLNNLSNIMIPFAAPVIRPNVYGILPADVPNRFVGWGIFSLPWKLKFSALLDVHSGYPYSDIDVLQQYVGTPNGRRFPHYSSLDLKAYRDFRIPFFRSANSKGHHLRLGIYTLDTLNHKNYTAVYNNIASPHYGNLAGYLYRHEGLVLDVVD